MSETRTHSRFAPSSLARILACPSSVRLAEAAIQEDARRARSSVWAAEGSVAHVVAEQYLGNGKSMLKPGKVVRYDGHDIVVTEEMHEHGRDYAAYVRGLIGYPHDQSFLVVEEVVGLDDVVGADAEMYGHLDAAAYAGDTRRLHVVDYKYGAGLPVSAQDNPQLMAYALGALARAGLTEATDVDLHVVQPRVRNEPSVWSLPLVDLMMWGDDVLAPVIRGIVEGTTPEVFTVGPHCRFCPATAICPAWAEKALGEAQAAFGGPPLADRPGAELAAALGRARELQPWIDAIEEEARDRLLDGKVVPGFKPVVAQWRRAWTKGTDARVISQALQLGIATVRTQPTLRTPADLEKMLPKERRGELAPYVTRQPHGIVVVPDDDKRPDSRLKEVQETPDVAP